MQDLLVYSRLSRTDVVLSSTSVNAALALVLQDLSAEIEAQRACISVQPAMPAVLAQRPLLEKVLGHLLSNALKFVAPGAIPQISVDAEERGPYVRVTVADNGVGIAPKYHGRIFLPFERLHGEDSYPGTGIGLAIARRALARMRGRVGVESSGAAGSRFWFELERGELMRKSTVGRNDCRSG